MRAPGAWGAPPVRYALRVLVACLAACVLWGASVVPSVMRCAVSLCCHVLCCALCPSVASLCVRFARCALWGAAGAAGGALAAVALRGRAAAQCWRRAAIAAAVLRGGKQHSRGMCWRRSGASGSPAPRTPSSSYRMGEGVARGGWRLDCREAKGLALTPWQRHCLGVNTDGCLICATFWHRVNPTNGGSFYASSQAYDSNSRRSGP